MKSRYTVKECYRILNIESGCDWKQLRKAYKIQIQKWHPDRFEEGSEKKQAADDKIKHINAAFQQLSEYYKKHGELPAIEEPQQAAQPAQPKPETKRPQPTPRTKPADYSPPKTPPVTPEKKKPVFLAVIIASLLVYIFIEFVPEETPVKKPTPTSIEQQYEQIRNQKQSITQQRLQNKTISDKQTRDQLTTQKNRTDKIDPADIILDEEEEFFTHGSSVGEVITVQGPPTKIIGDVWYYDQSTVTFHEGHVITWHREPGSPIKAGLLLPKIKKDQKKKKKDQKDSILDIND